MCCFYFARTAILAGVAGLGKGIVPLVRLGLGGIGRNGPELMGHVRENRGLHDRCEFGDRMFIVRLIVFHSYGFLDSLTFALI